jgi:hypothetical protein
MTNKLGQGSVCAVEASLWEYGLMLFPWKWIGPLSHIFSVEVVLDSHIFSFDSLIT